MATDINAIKLHDLAKKIETMASESDGYVLLTQNECMEIVAIMRESALSLDGWINGG